LFEGGWDNDFEKQWRIDNGEWKIPDPVFNFQLSIFHYPFVIFMLRRRFIRLLSQGIIGSALLPGLAFGVHPVDKRRLQFVFAQLKYRGGDWNPHPLSVTPLMEELMLRTSVEAATVRHEVSLTDRDLFNYPFLYLTGKYVRALHPGRDRHPAPISPTAASC
jgi:hypothetical protein